MENPIFEAVLDYFNGDEIAANVWLSKYRYKDEALPSDSHKRHQKEIVEKALIRIKQIHSEQLNNLSSHGQIFFSGLMVDDNVIKDLIESTINYQKIVLAGSMQQGIGNHDFFSSLSNCFVAPSPHDSYGGINKVENTIVQMMKRRGGAGSELSTIRPRGARVKNQAQISTGVIPFAEGYSNKTIQVAQEGRRGALMLSLDIMHPDSPEYIAAKQDLTKITGANISTRIPDEFMEAMEADEKIVLRWPILNKQKELIQVDAITEKIDNWPMNKLISAEDLDLPANHPEYFKIVSAKELWNLLIKCAWKTAEPGILFTGNWLKGGLDYDYPLYRPVSTNPCFAGNTPFLTSEGYFNLEDKVNQTVRVWNGKLWSDVTVKETGQNEPMLKIETSDGAEFECTDYHTWLTWVGFSRQGHEKKRMARNLKPGDKLVKFDLPVVEGGNDLSIDAYSQGFYVGDGRSDRNGTYLYGEKIKLAEYLKGSFGESVDLKNYYGTDKKYFTFSDKMISKDFVPLHGYSVKTRLDWLAGLIDADGCHDEIGGCQIGSTNLNVIKQTRLMLNTLGVSSKINNLRNEGYYDLPDQKGGTTNVFCKAGYRLLINGTDIQHLLKLGLTTHRVGFTKFNPKRDAKRFVTVKKITRIENADKVYCFTEPISNRAIFNGLLIGQCSEIPMQPYDACRLLAVNLLMGVDKPYSDVATVDWKRLYEIFYFQIVVGDLLIDLECDYIDRIIAKIETLKAGELDGLSEDEREEVLTLKNDEATIWKKIKKMMLSGRRIGAGFTALADYLAAQGLPYYSPDDIGKVFQLKLGAELDATTDLAVLYGAFEGFNPDNEGVYTHEFIKTNYPKKYQRMMEHGRRNISFSTAAPVGSTSLMTGTASGIEPVFLPLYKRRKKCLVKDDRVDYIDADGEKFMEFYVVHPQLKHWISVNKGMDLYDVDHLNNQTLEAYFEESPWYGSCANDLEWQQRVEIQSIVQRYTTHAISSTINLPEDVKVETIGNIYLQSWKSGLKGNTVYRDGARGGILVGNDEKPQQAKPDRPRRIKGHYYTVKTPKKTFSVILGIDVKNDLHEIFIVSGLDNLPEILDQNEFIEGEIVKEADDWYNFEADTFVLREIHDMEHDEKLISLTLSYFMRNSQFDDIIKLIEKTNPFAGTFNFRLIKILKKYIGNLHKDECPECGEEMKWENGCCTCPACGWSKC